MGIFSDFQIDQKTIENMVQSGYDQAKKQKNIIEKFIKDENLNSETLSQTESDLIHKIIIDVENDNLSEKSDSNDSNSD
jgi:aconitase B